MKIDTVEINADALTVLTELQAQLRANGIQLLDKIKDSGDDIMISCPYHKDGQERRPSAGIRKNDGVFHCFTCGEVHTLPEVISYCFGKGVSTFGWNWLLRNFATASVHERKDVKLDFNRKRTVENRTFISESELAEYRYFHPYMYKRGLTDSVIELFDIGYDIKTDCITFPVRDIEGRTLFIARRSVKGKFFNYPQGAEKPLYGIYELQTVDTQDVIVTESMLDALSFWTINKYAVALNGLGSELQFKQLRELSCRKLILATDMDERGLAARKQIRTNVSNKLITEYYFPVGRKDANECTKDELKNLFEKF